MRVRFWGTRGSLPKPGPTTLRYGGNTPCVELRTDDGMLIILDCGSGLHDLGLDLLANSRRPIHGHIFVTHTHWDHIQGFPFFAPVFVPGNEFDLYAPGGMGQRLEATLAGQMEYTYFPVTLDQLGSTIRWHDLVEGTFNLGNLRITACYMNHPAVTLGYRFEIGGAEVVYATDHEPHLVNLDDRSPSITADVQTLSAHPEDWRHVEFLAGADLVIHDAQYTLEEYPSKIGWGHTPVERAVDFAVAAGNKRLAIFHHDPLRDDDTLDRLVEVCRQRAAACGSPLEVFGAAEGQTIDLPEGELSLPLEIGPSAFRVAPDDGHSTHPKTILIVDDEPDIVRLLTVSLRPEGFRLLSTNDGEAALRLAHDEMPDLILLDWNLPTRNGLDVCRAIRAAGDQRLREVPIVMLTGRAGPEETTAGFAAGATDYLTKPFTPAHVRSRVREWLLRARAGSLTG